MVKVLPFLVLGIGAASALSLGKVRQYTEYLEELIRAEKAMIEETV
jgi:hypothetical protein